MSVNIKLEQQDVDVKDKIYNIVKSKKTHSGDPTLLPIFDYDNFPIIDVTFSTTLDRPAFDFFLRQWLECYTREENFNFIFDLNHIKWINPSYSLLVIKFMKQLRLHIEELSYLKTSIMIITNDFIRGLAYYIFQIQKPISHVYLVSTKEHANKIASGDDTAKKFSVNIPPNTLLK